jgi:hypothetical protein
LRLRLALRRSLYLSLGLHLLWWVRLLSLGQSCGCEHRQNGGGNDSEYVCGNVAAHFNSSMFRRTVALGSMLLIDS